METRNWLTSSRCGKGSCVYVAFGPEPDTVWVSDDREGMCRFTFADWRAFIAAVKVKEFDLPGPNSEVHIFPDGSTITQTSRP